MAYEWPLEPEALFLERYPHMTSTGMPAVDVDGVRAEITDMWADGPGGWVHEWSRVARRYAGAGRHDLAALAYGWAKFPSLANTTRRDAFEHQLSEYLLAASGFDVGFERRVVTVPDGTGGRVDVPVHLFAVPGVAADVPVLLVSGGVDTWKMDLHAVLVGFTQLLRVRVLAFDLPGTGDTPGPMTPHGGAAIVTGLIGHARGFGARRIGHLGVSMGGHYAARSGLEGAVDAAVVLGGPVERAFAPGWKPSFGMDGIVGNALGLTAPPGPADWDTLMPPFSLRPLLDQDRNAPMLVVNGADDVHVPPHDTLVFEGRRDTRTLLLPDAGHCAVRKLDEVLPETIAWLTDALGS